MTEFRANLIASLHKAQRTKNLPVIQCWHHALKAYDARNVDSLNFWIRHGAYLLPEMREKALTVKPITLEGLLAYEKEQLHESRICQKSAA